MSEDQSNKPVYAVDFDNQAGIRFGHEVIGDALARAKRFDISGFSVPSIKIVSVHIDSGRPYVQIELTVNSRENGEPIAIAFVRDIDRGADAVSELSDEELRRMVWQGCMLALAHEVDECLKMDGEKLREAHPGDQFAEYDFRRMDSAPVSAGEVADLEARIATLQGKLGKEQSVISPLRVGPPRFT